MIENNEIAKLKAEVKKLKTDLAVVNNSIAEIISALELKADKDNIINLINISGKGVLIDGKKIHITSETMIDDKLKHK